MSSSKVPRHILRLSTKEKRKLFDSVDRVFSDIDGVVWNLEHPYEGAAAAFNELRHQGKELTFITNNSVRSMQDCLKRFAAIGLNVSAEDVIHPAQNIVDYLKSIQFEGLIYAIGTEIVKDQLRAAGYKLIDGPTKVLGESYRELAKHVFDGQPVRAVVIDVDFNLSSTKLIRAQVYLRHPDCLLIAGATDMLLPVRSDISIIGPGPFNRILADIGQKEMIVLGKPGRVLAQMLLQRYAIKEPRRVLMIGDMLEQDVGFGQECGFQTLLVLSGGTSLADLQTEARYVPDFYADSMADVVQFIKELNKAKA